MAPFKVKVCRTSFFVFIERNIFALKLSYGVRGRSRTLGNYPSPALALTYKVLLGLFTTGSASLSYLTEALVHIYIPQPRGDLAVRCLCREGLTHSRGCCPFFRVAFPHLCVLIIAHFVEFVKRFLKKFATFFDVENVCACNFRGYLFHRCALGFRALLIESFCCSPLLTYLLYHTLTYLSRGFNKISLRFL